MLEPAMAAIDETLGAARRGLLPATAVRLVGRVRRLSLAERLVYGFTSAYALVFALFAVARHLAFQTQSFDLGIMTQAIWSTVHGHFLEITSQRGEEVTRLAVHVDPFLAFLTPLWVVWPSPLMLLVFQAVAVSLG